MRHACFIMVSLKISHSSTRISHSYTRFSWTSARKYATILACVYAILACDNLACDNLACDNLACECDMRCSWLHEEMLQRLQRKYRGAALYTVHVDVNVDGRDFCSWLSANWLIDWLKVVLLSYSAMAHHQVSLQCRWEGCWELNELWNNYCKPPVPFSTLLGNVAKAVGFEIDRGERRGGATQEHV